MGVIDFHKGGSSRLLMGVVCLVVALVALVLVAGTAVAQPARKVSSKTVVEQVASARTESIFLTLQKPIDLQWDQLPANEALDELSQHLGVTIQIDLAALKDYFEEDFDRKTSLRATDISAHAALSFLLRPEGLAWSLEDEVVWVTTKEKSSEALITRIYEVGDLVQTQQGGFVDVDYESLLDLLTSIVEPDSWIENGGNGEARPFESKAIFLVVVSQTAQVHLKIEAVLRAIRLAKQHVKIASPNQSSSQLSLLPASSPSVPASSVPSSKRPNATANAPKRIPIELVRARNLFACDLYRQLAKEEPNESLLFSPLSLYETLGMVHAGAEGKTAKQIETVCHFPLQDEPLHRSLAAMHARWQQQGRFKGSQLRVANRIWCSPTLTIQEPFAQAMENDYGAKPGLLDFRHPAKATKVMNAWCKQQTGGMIQQLVAPGDLSPDTAIAVANAVLFEGKWARSFAPSATYNGAFHAFGGKQRVRMMTSEETCRYAQVDHVQILEKPYGGGRVVLWCVLPEAGREPWGAVQASLSPVTLNRWAGALDSQKVKVHLPKFTFDSRPNVKAALQTLGLTSLFDIHQANLSGLSPQPLSIGPLVHAARIEVNERGTRAAAASMGGGTFGGPPPPRRLPIFKANRPFLFLIYDKSAGAILFVGHYMGPTT